MCRVRSPGTSAQPTRRRIGRRWPRRIRGSSRERRAVVYPGRILSGSRRTTEPARRIVTTGAGAYRGAMVWKTWTAAAIAAMAWSSVAAAQDATPVAPVPAAVPAVPVPAPLPVQAMPAPAPPAIVPVAPVSVPAQPTGTVLVILGSLGVAAGAGTLATTPLCRLSIIRSSAQPACIGTSIGVGAALAAVGIPLLVTGLHQRAAFRLLPTVTVGSGSASMTWRTDF